MPYGIILLPPPEFSARVVEYSNQLATFTPHVTMALDLVQRPPHLTLLHVDCDEDVAVSWWSQAEMLLEPDFTITLTGLAFAPIQSGNYYVPEGGLYFGLEAQSSTALREAHLRLLNLANELRITPLGAVGENFSPHITLGVLQEFPVGGVSVPSRIVTATITGHLALGRLGDYGTFPDILTTTANVP